MNYELRNILYLCTQNKKNENNKNHPIVIYDVDSHVCSSDSTVVLTSTLVMPNAFSPNNDRINDVYKVKSYQNIVEFHAYIFNRWGQKLYDWTNIEEGWDGKYRGNDVKQGTYFVLVKAKGADGQTYNIRKDVNLLRGYTEGTSLSQ